MKKDMISIIVPAFNAEKYIARCLDALRACFVDHWLAVTGLQKNKDTVAFRKNNGYNALILQGFIVA
ncbi:MAG: hypothetical protein PHX68_01155 [Alphaproteobacteria bacterium]|nr:hypothetical protein [Alphaproteobacteria bacterium]